MTAAIFGLVGVIVGGVLTGVMTYLLERTRARRTAVAGARLVLEELWNAYRNIADAGSLFGLWARRDSISSQAFHDNKAALAAELTFQQWRSLADAYDSLRNVHQILATSTDRLLAWDKSEEATLLEIWRDSVTGGIGAVAPLAGWMPGSGATGGQVPDGHLGSTRAQA